jgi:hypothetical protein
MPIGDDRTVDEIRAGGDELSVTNNYTEHFLGTSQPGLTREQRGEEGYAEPDMSIYESEDDPRWYESDDDDLSVPELDQETFNSHLQAWAQDWTEQQQQANDPRAQVAGFIDDRIQNQLAELQEAQEWAAQGRTERQQTLEIQQAQDDLNAANEGTARLGQIAQSTAEYHGLPPSHPEAVQAEAGALFDQLALAYLNNGGRPDEWENVKQEYAQRCVEEAAIRLGRQTISDNALKRV